MRHHSESARLFWFFFLFFFLRLADRGFDFPAADKCGVAPRSVSVTTAQVGGQMAALSLVTPATRKSCVPGKASTALWLQPLASGLALSYIQTQKKQDIKPSFVSFMR